MSADAGLIDWVAEALAPLGTVTQRRMRGGAVLYLDGVVFALVDDETLWFKADAESAALWDEAGCARFTYLRDGTPQAMNYRRAPDDVYDDADAMREWAAPAIAAGQRTPRKKAKRG